MVALKVMQNLRKSGIRVFVVLQPHETMFNASYPYEYVKKHYDKTFTSHPYIIFVLETTKGEDGKDRVSKRKVWADHNVGGKRNIVLNAFKRYPWFHWDGTLAQRMRIDL